MFIDFIPILVAIIAITTGPLIIGLILRLFGLRLLARIAAALTIVICIAFVVLVGMGGGSGWVLVAVQMALAVVLWVRSPLEARTLTGRPEPAAQDAPD